VLVTGDLGHLATLRTVLAGLARGSAVRVSDRTHLAAHLAHRRHDEVVTTPLLLRRALRQLRRRDRHPAGTTRLVLHQGHVRPHEWSAWADGPADVVQSRVSLTEAGGWMLLGERPAPGVELAVAGDGSVTCSGPEASPAGASGDRPEVGWSTGDLAERRADGTVHWRGRRRDRFVADGHEVDPVEVEAVLASHPLVAEVAVAPRPHPERGNLVVAVLVPADPEWPPFLDDLAPVTAALPHQARPSALAVVDDLPLNAAGAVHRRLVNYEEAGR
jgi:acyl-coenzyme A synthetase/AMP-(fatty) acid ligase